MLELLKQGIYAPVIVEKQTCALYAWWKGYLDNIPVKKVLKFEADLYAALDEEKTILEEISNTKVMSAEATEKLEKILKKVAEMNK
jgi:F-type H+-transporting ATPase subunit alpha